MSLTRYGTERRIQSFAKIASRYSEKNKVTTLIFEDKRKENGKYE